MLGAAARAIRAVDRGAEIVTARVPDSTLGVALERYVRETLVAGARGDFDPLAINPYATSDLGVLAATGVVRRLLNGAGLGTTPIWLTAIDLGERRTQGRASRSGCGGRRTTCWTRSRHWRGSHACYSLIGHPRQTHRLEKSDG
jgi:hypothetical protein